MAVEQNKKLAADAGTEAIRSAEPNTQSKGILNERFPTLRSLLGWLFVISFGFLSLVAAFTLHHLVDPGLRIGDLADKDIKATRTVTVFDETSTRRAQERARRSVVPIFKEDKSNYQAFLNDVRQKLADAKKLQDVGIVSLSPQLTPARQLKLLIAGNPDEEGQALSLKTKASLEKQRAQLKAMHVGDTSLDASQIYCALGVAPKDWSKFTAATESSAARLCRVMRRYPEIDDASWFENAIEFLPDQFPPTLKERCAVLICSALKPNLIVDEEATNKKADAVVAGVPPLVKTYHSGDIILHKGEIVTAENINGLSAAQAVADIRWRLIFSLILSLFACTGLVGLYLYIWQPKHFFSTASIGLMLTVAVLATLASIALSKICPAFAPLPSAALVLTIFFGRRIAFAITFPILVLLAVDRVIDLNNLIALGTASGAAIGTYSKHRHDLVFTGFVIGMMQALGFIASLSLLPSITSPALLGKFVALEFLGGVTSAIASIGSLPFLENIYGVLTPFRLAELTDADQPLLRKLEEEAPGTYQHSLAVANLAEAGAHAIGANANLVRAGALYHDIGKLVRPKYFIENQLGDKNPHDSMTPEDSRQRVLAHVTDGIALAKKYSLPKAIEDFIPMHQGTSLMAYFYHKACLRDGVDKVDPALYRYPGPRPQSKETAIVMMADVSEAVTRSMTDSTQEEVGAALAKVFENRWQDGQFDQSTLTYNELNKVREAFTRVWRTLHHERLKYPPTTSGRMPIPPESLNSGS